MLLRLYAWMFLVFFAVIIFFPAIYFQSNFQFLCESFFFAQIYRFQDWLAHKILNDYCFKLFLSHQKRQGNCKK